MPRTRKLTHGPAPSTNPITPAVKRAASTYKEYMALALSATNPKVFDDMVKRANALVQFIMEQDPHESVGVLQAQAQFANTLLKHQARLIEMHYEKEQEERVDRTLEIVVLEPSDFKVMESSTSDVKVPQEPA